MRACICVLCEEKRVTTHNTQHAHGEHVAKCGRHFGNGAGAA